MSNHLSAFGRSRFHTLPRPRLLPFCVDPGVISMRINVAINHSVPPLPDVIQGLLKTSALRDVYGRREIWAWQPSPKTLVQSPCGTLIQSGSYYCPGSSQAPETEAIQARADWQLWFLIDPDCRGSSGHSHTHRFCCVFQTFFLTFLFQSVVHLLYKQFKLDVRNR